ncbi:hypothetical protein, partial [Pseudomonas izuensis]|uniref:hypothetical protein n=1 Tax=Pseudomonas izuensis TaxID=2684212 RepID=UPI001C498741
STRPHEGARKSKAKAERGGLTADLISRMNAFHCRSEPAREKRPDNAGIQAVRVIVDVLREQARSYRGLRTHLNQVGCQAASVCF